MGRHGTGGSDDGDERGNGSAFWGPDDPAEAPGWPALPDQVEVTGQWAPMPRREDGPPQRGRQPEPFETTGAFAVPADAAPGFTPSDDPAGSFPPPSGPAFSGSPYSEPNGPAFSGSAYSESNGPGFPGAPYPEPNGAGPFEVTGAFARPADWDAVGPSGGPSGGPPSQPGAPPSFDASGRTTGPFDAPQRNTGPFDAPQRNTGPFDASGRNTGPFDGQGRNTGPFDAQEPGGTARFDLPEPGSTARFDVPGGPDGGFPGRPPEPGDVKVAGEPTAVHTPAWAEAETGFLRSGWSSDQDLDELDETDESRGRRRGGRRRSSGGGGDGGGDDDGLNAPTGGGRGRGKGNGNGNNKGRLALLSVAAVAVVLGGTVAGVKLMSSSGDPGTCADASCAAVHTSTSPSTATVSDPTDEEEPSEEPTDEPSEDEDASTPSDAPTTTAPTYGNRPPRRSSAPTPTPTRTRPKPSTKPTRAPEPPPEEAITETPTDDATTVGNTDGGVVPTVGSSTVPEPTSTAGYGGSGGSVNVRQTVKQRLTAYSATLRVTNQSQAPLDNATFSLPVEGRVTNVNGGAWTQDGDLLIIDLSGSLAAGDSVDVTYSATGKAQEPGACGLVGGECAIG
ncbi:hypothetical protein ABZ815_14385 [Nonomuraea sp. NPDC047529]|uniref:hypothetical protein n=1 Tax=Nonomuraea sp. NPDC047529 TaxID=3155623 RepID=UPI0033F4244B